MRMQASFTFAKCANHFARPLASRPAAFQARIFGNGRNYKTSAILNNKDGAQFGGEVSKLYNNFFVNGKEAWHLTSALVQKLNSGATTITDIASGPGEPACTIAQDFPEAKVLCTDISADMIQQANDRKEKLGLKNIECMTMGLNDLSAIAPNSQDVVVVQFGLMFTEDLDGALNQIHTILKPGGYMVATVWNQFKIVEINGKIMTEILGVKPPPPPINPLSMSDEAATDIKITNANRFELVKGEGLHNTVMTLPFNLGNGQDAFKTLCIPVFPKLLEMMGTPEYKDVDLIEKAAGIAKELCNEYKYISSDGSVQINDAYFRYLVAKKI